MSESNTSFIEKLRKNDPSVMDDLFAVYHKKLYYFAFAYLKNEEDSMDIVQEVFIKIWKNRLNLLTDSNFDSYIFSISKNTIISVFRRRATEIKYRDFFSEKEIINSLDTEEQVNYEMLNERYNELVNKLPPKRKEIFLLSRKDGLSHKEISQLKKISCKTVEDHINKALTFFKDNKLNMGIWAMLFYLLFID